jgi:hypothetical protein
MSTSAPLVCLFSVPKPFSGLAAIHQVNAVKSWRKLGDDVEVLLCGDEEGVADTAAELGVRHHATIARNEFGTPLINDAFESARQHSSARLLCYINADIMLMSDFVRALKAVNVSPFVLCGRRWNLEVPELIDFDAPEWETSLRARVRTSGELHSPAAMDYFAFPRGLVRDMPPFAIGRAAWDNWLLFHTRVLGVPLIDATAAVTIVHQNHTYGHVQGGVQGAWYGPEARRNRALASEMLFPFTIANATHDLLPTGIRPKPVVRNPVRRLESTIAVALRERHGTRRALRRLLRAKDA